MRQIDWVDMAPCLILNPILVRLGLPQCVLDRHGVWFGHSSWVRLLPRPWLRDGRELLLRELTHGALVKEGLAAVSMIIARR